MPIPKTLFSVEGQLDLFRWASAIVMRMRASETGAWTRCLFCNNTLYTPLYSRFRSRPLSPDVILHAEGLDVERNGCTALENT
jgi:hypothetical protein